MRYVKIIFSVPMENLLSLAERGEARARLRFSNTDAARDAREDIREYEARIALEEAEESLANQDWPWFEGSAEKNAKARVKRATARLRRASENARRARNERE